MALIKCPECGREVSDKAPVCIHCGCPLGGNDNDKLNSYYDIIYKGYTSQTLERNNKLNTVKHLMKINNLSISQNGKMLDNPPQTLFVGVTKENAEWLKKSLSQYGCIIEIKESSQKSANEQNDKLDVLTCNGGTILCPNCGSNDVAEEQRGYSLFSGFIGSSKIMHRCKSCKYKW